MFFYLSNQANMFIGICVSAGECFLEFE